MEDINNFLEDISSLCSQYNYRVIPIEDNQLAIVDYDDNILETILELM